MIDFNLKEANRVDVERVAWINGQFYRKWAKHSGCDKNALFLASINLAGILLLLVVLLVLLALIPGEGCLCYSVSMLRRLFACLEV